MFHQVLACCTGFDDGTICAQIAIQYCQPSFCFIRCLQTGDDIVIIGLGTFIIFLDGFAIGRYPVAVQFVCHLLHDNRQSTRIIKVFHEVFT